MIIIYPLIFLLANCIPLQNYQESHDLVPEEEISLLNIANYFQGTFVYVYLDLGNKENETKRIIIAIILSIVLIVVLCVFIQFVLNISKQCSIQLNVDKQTPLTY